MRYSIPARTASNPAGVAGGIRRAAFSTDACSARCVARTPIGRRSVTVVALSAITGSPAPAGMRRSSTMMSRWTMARGPFVHGSNSAAVSRRTASRRTQPM